MAVSYDGQTLFGLAVRCRVIQNPSATQINEFFGVDGVQSLHGGTRGRAISVEGVLFAEDGSGLGNLITSIENYNDGIGREFIDSYDRSFSNVVFVHFEPGERVIQGDDGYYLPYKSLFEGRS